MKISQRCCLAAIVMCVSMATAGPIMEGSCEGCRVVFYVSHPGSLREVEIDPILFSTVGVNRGSAYNPLTGVFTAPRSGVYHFLFSSQLCRGAHNNAWYIMVDYHKKAVCHGQVSSGGTALTTCSYMEELREGQEVWVRQEEGSCAWADSSSRSISFSGVLLTSDGEVGPLPKEVSSATASLSSFSTALLVALFSFCSFNLLS